MGEIPKEVKTNAIPNRSWYPLDNGAVCTDHRAMSKRAGVAIAYSSPQKCDVTPQWQAVLRLPALLRFLSRDSALQPSGEHTRMLNRMRG